MKKGFIVFGVFFIIIACKPSKNNVHLSNTREQKHRMMEWSVGNIKDTLVVNLMDSIKLSYRTNPSTGYMWEWVNNNNEHIDSIENNFISDDNPQNYDGVGGVDTWIFKAKKVGIDSIVMIHHRWGDFENADYSRTYLKIQ